MKSSETFIRVRYEETDQMGVVYYAKYFVWFEVGRSEFFRGIGMPYVDFEKNDILLPVIQAYAEYKAPARYDDLVRVVTRVSSLNDVRLAFHYEIFRNEDNRLLVLGGTEHAFVNSDGRPVVLKKHNPFLWRRLLEAAGEQQE